MADSAADTLPPPPRRPKILLVDDSSFSLSQLSKALDPEFEVITACGGAEGLATLAQHKVALVITDLLMTLRFPGVVLHLGRDVSGEFPPELRAVDYPPLRTLLASIDPTPNATAGSGVDDWANLRQRMHYIADLFRCWHARPELFTAPFTPAQVAALREGRRPDGSL